MMMAGVCWFWLEGRKETVIWIEVFLILGGGVIESRGSGGDVSRFSSSRRF